MQKLGIFYTLKKPPVFDTANLSITHRFMTSFLFSQCYFNTAISDTFYVDTVHKAGAPAQYRTTVEMDIDAGKRVVIDSFGYDLQNKGLQNIAKNNSKESKIERA